MEMFKKKKKKKRRRRHRTSGSHGRKCFIFPECFRGYRLPQRARMKDDLAPCSNSLSPCSNALWLSHLLKPSHLSQWRKTYREIIPLPLLCPALVSSSFFLSFFKVGFNSVSVSRIPSSSLASVCFWHRGASQGVTARWASDVKHVCSLVLWRLNQAEGEGRRLELHLWHKTSQGITSS